MVLEREALIGEREPLADKRASHGICARELEERVTRLPEAERQHVDVEDLRKGGLSSSVELCCPLVCLDSGILGIVKASTQR